LQILQNERHCGDVLSRKTWTPSYLDHLSRKNKNDKDQFRKRDHHEAIVSRDDFITVQRLISNAKYGNKGILPELKVVSEGALKGFVSINPRWGAFRAEEYRAASASVCDEAAAPSSEPLEIVAQSGDFDLRGFEIARSQFFDTGQRVCVTFTIDSIWFSTECVRKFDKEFYVELLVHPGEQLLAVRPCLKSFRNAIRWVRITEEINCPRPISGAAYLDTLYEIFGWNLDYRYRVRGIRRKKGDESVVVFDMREVEVFIPPDVSNDGPSGPVKRVAAFPPEWAHNFGYNYYRHTQARELAAIDKDGMWDIAVEAQTYNGIPESNITGAETLLNNIQRLLKEMEQGEQAND